MPDPRYPVGKFERPASVSPADRETWIREIAETPANVRAAVAALPEGGLDRPYREGGWTGRQVVHHIVDSHLNSYIRFRWALTEDVPTIKAYFEERWAELPDAKNAPVDVSLALLDSLHQRWVLLLRSLTPADFERRLVHPESGEFNLNGMLALYAWHGRHHIAHLRAIR